MRDRWRWAVVAAGMLVLASCSSAASDGDASGSARTAGSDVTAKIRPMRWAAQVAAEHELPGEYRQGVARSGDGWIFVTNNAIYRTDERFRQVQAKTQAIPQELRDAGFDHLGDPDVHDGEIWIPLERDDKSKALQRIAVYDEDSLAFVFSGEVAQHHASFVAVDEQGTVFSTDQFSDDTILRYTVDPAHGQRLSEPLRMSRKVERIQGGDIADGAIWLSTDDDHNGVYRVDLQTGQVTDLGAAKHVAGEGEGIDATEVDGNLLHVLVADEAIVPMWLDAMRVTSKPA